jgi:serine/threonine-protein kinase
VEIIEKRRKVPDLGAIDMRFRPLLERMLQPDPGQRPDSMAAVAAWSLGSAPLGRRTPKLDRPQSPAKGSAPRPSSRRPRRWARAAAALLLIALLGGGAGLYIYAMRMPFAPTLAAEDIRRYVERYDGGDCFFVAPTAISEHAAVVEGFGSSTKPFMAFDAEFQRTTGFEADIGVRQITEPQCPAITFLARLRGENAHAPRLDIDQENLRNGDVLNGVVDRYGSRNVDLILVSDAGTVQNISSQLKPGVDAKTFNLGMRRTEGAAGRQPQLLIAVASPSPASALQLARPAEAEQFFSRALSEAARSGTSLSAVARYFMLEN